MAHHWPAMGVGVLFGAQGRGGRAEFGKSISMSGNKVAGDPWLPAKYSNQQALGSKPIASTVLPSFEALRLIGFEAVANLGTTFLVFAANILLGLAIIGLGLFLSHVSSNAILSMKASQTEFLAFAARASIVVLAVAIGLGQMGLATEIIALAFGILFGAIALATALAFGLGSRETAGRLFEAWVSRFEQSETRKGGRRSSTSE